MKTLRQNATVSVRDNRGTDWARHSKGPEMEKWREQTRISTSCRFLQSMTFDIFASHRSHSVRSWHRERGVLIAEFYSSERTGNALFWGAFCFQR
jgi:hypothetical protein